MTADLNKLTVVELRAELKKHGLPQAGKKAELVERLSSAADNGSSNDTNGETTAEVEQSPQTQDAPEVATSTPAATVEASPVSAAVQDEQVPDAPASVAAAVPIEVNQVVPTADRPSNGIVDTPSHPEPVVTTTIQISEGSASSETAPPVAEIISDVQTRKRRSRTPSIDDSVRKRLRPDDPEPRRVDTDTDEAVQVSDDYRDPLDQEHTAEVRNEPLGLDGVQDADAPMANIAVHAHRDDTKDVDDVVMEDDYKDRSGHGTHPQDSVQTYDTERMQEDGPAEADYAADERPVVPAIHPATSALYIRNLMRPLRPADVKEHLIALATPPSQEPNPDVIVDFFLDHIRTHAFVILNSISAAARVRSALHDRVWPDERNRKALWVDFIPADKVREWIDTEEGEAGGRGQMNRWEVVYESDVDGNMTARLEEAGPDTARPAQRPAAPPTGPASSFIPTGPSQPASGVQGAPTGPRGRGGRMPPGYPLQGGVTPQEGAKTTRALPSLLYRPQSEDVARRRIDNMRSYYTKDMHRDMGPVEDINRYTFENVDAFVDRGKEVFVGIRPPHRERHMRGGAGGGPGRRPPLGGPRRGGPPPPSFRPRGDRYIGGRNGGGDGFGPRSRFDGAPLPTYDGPPARRGRFGR
jgi:SAP domain-containing ribonucleoprotein